MRCLKFLTLGDKDVGITSLLMTFTTGEYPEGYVPTVFDNHAFNLKVDGEQFILGLFETSGQQDYNLLRPLSYPLTDCFLLFYSIDSRTTFDNVLSKWYPEVRQFSPDIPIIIVGTKLDLRTENSGDLIKFDEARKLRDEIGAKTKQNIDVVFQEAVRAAIRKPKETAL